MNEAIRRLDLPTFSIMTEFGTNAWRMHSPTCAAIDKACDPPWTNSSAEQLTDRFAAAVNHVAGSALLIVILNVDRHVEVPEQRRRQIAGSHRAIEDRAAVPFGRADHLPVPQPAAGHAHRHHDGPVVTTVRAALGTHRWR